MTTLGIVGFGSFGRFMVQHLRSRFSIRVHDRLDVEDEAAQLGVRSAPLHEVAASEILVLAVPVQNMEDVLRDLRGVPRLPELVMDVGSVKVKPLDLMSRHLPKRVEVVGSHPMFGPQSGRHGIAGLKVVLCPLRTRRLARIRDLLERELRLEVMEMSPEKHDSEMAYIQGLTHWIAKALREIKLPDLSLATPAYRHLLKIEENLREDSAALFRTIQAENPFAAGARAELMAKLREIEAEVTALAGEDADRRLMAAEEAPPPLRRPARRKRSVKRART
ncbi:MAG TPA: prephenate dehydrogenase [Thermoanaerobaculia bacterium]|nr:prephenate dehydrogenase [Thermoanaerobaculia bacterium]